MTANKQQLIDFIAENFVNADGEHPTKSQLGEFKKEELTKVVANACVSKQLDEYVKANS